MLQLVGYNIYCYRKGSLVPYTGGRMAPEMVDWLEKKIGPPAQVKTSPKDLPMQDYSSGVTHVVKE